MGEQEHPAQTAPLRHVCLIAGRREGFQDALGARCFDRHKGFLNMEKMVTVPSWLFHLLQ
jgi:hypothetical protein